ncbi:MAG: cysteine hydrolase family protein [Spirochaetia bacterium]
MRDWKHHCLLVIDIQTDFVDDIPEKKQFRQNIENLLSLAREAGIEIMHLRSEFLPDKSDWMPFAGLRNFSPCVINTEGGSVPHWAQAAGTEEIIIKKTFDGFIHTKLEEMLKRKDVSHVLIAGLVTSICVNLTALSAMQRGFLTTVITDSIADNNPANGDYILHTLYGAFAYNTVVSNKIIDSYEKWISQMNTIRLLRRND